MPEGHTLFRNARELREAFAGLPTRVSSPQGRFAADAAVLDGAEVLGAESAGKHLFVEFAGDRLVHVHLGLIGTFDVVTGASEVPPPVGQVRLRLQAQPPRRRGVRRPPRCHHLRPGGPAPGGTRWSATSARTRCATTPTPTGPGGGSGAASDRSATC